MKNIFKLTTLLFFGVFSYAQNEMEFRYDAAGNQTSRVLILNNWAKQAESTEKKVTNQELLKFFPEDVISYYPNPVKEQLYLQWELTNNILVKTITIYNTNGQQVNFIEKLEQQNNQTINFNTLPLGLYLVNLNYSNGEVKTINIIKD